MIRQRFGISGFSFGPDPIPKAAELASVNFTLSETAVAAIARSRKECEADDPGSAGIFSIYWMPEHEKSGPCDEAGHLAFGFYPDSQREELAHLIRTVSGVDLILAATPEQAPIFDGKVLDYSPERRFFLRVP
jgi:hypothetical protein